MIAEVIYVLSVTVWLYLFVVGETGKLTLIVYLFYYVVREAGKTERAGRGGDTKASPDTVHD
jgi:hypothetical protein